MNGETKIKIKVIGASILAALLFILGLFSGSKRTNNGGGASGSIQGDIDRNNSDIRSELDGIGSGIDEDKGSLGQRADNIEQRSDNIERGQAEVDSARTRINSTRGSVRNIINSAKGATDTESD